MSSFGSRSRAPQGARGLKYCFGDGPLWTFWSRPARGAWVEISPCRRCCPCSGSRPARGAWVEIPDYRRRQRPWLQSRPARGAWVEIFLPQNKAYSFDSRAPQGARGLKSVINAVATALAGGRAPQGARGLKSRGLLRPPARWWSRPARGAWVEIVSRRAIQRLTSVAPRKGRVG